MYKVNSKEKEAVDKKMARLVKILPEKVVPKVDIKKEKNKFIATVSFSFLRTYIKGEGTESSPINAVNSAVDDAIRKYRKFKGKHFEKQGKRISEHLSEHLMEEKEENISMDSYEDYSSSSDIPTEITKVSNIKPKPMTINEALKIIETTGNEFVAFYDINGEVSIVYKRNNGYGILRG